MRGSRPLPAVKAVIEREGKILVLETEGSESPYWVLPGGKIEYGESPEEALKREIREEISCSMEIGEPVGMYHFFAGEEDKGDQVVLTASRQVSATRRSTSLITRSMKV